MRVLVTFPGKHGDILWAAQSARALAATGVEVDFAVMPRYKAVLPLLQIQPYIREAFAIEGWEQRHDNWGAQPRIPPTTPGSYARIHHLGYEMHPSEPLIMYGLRKLGLPMPDPPAPFFFVEAKPVANLVTYAFNGAHRQEKARILAQLRRVLPKAKFENTEALPFDEAARRIQASRFFFGCRSSNYVVAQGLGKRVLTIEPDQGRRSPVFGWPDAREHMPDPAFVHQFLDLALEWMKDDATR